MSRKAWLVALWLYAIAAAGDLVFHLNADVAAGQSWLAPDNLAVALAASLFWPADAVARWLLAG